MQRVSSTLGDAPQVVPMPPPLLLYCLSILLSSLSVLADPGALYPPGLQPLINRANALLSAGTFHDAAKAYSDAIGT
jgi:DnaJ family protein C protein 3